MEDTKRQLGMFCYHVFIFGGGIFYVLAGLAVSGYLSIGFHRYDSKFETVINQVNPEAEARIEMAAINEEQQSRTASSMKRLGVK